MANNHPNRNWRARARQACEDWLQTSEGRVMAEVPMRDMSGMSKRLRQAYIAGYDAGRKDVKK